MKTTVIVSVEKNILYNMILGSQAAVSHPDNPVTAPTK